MMNVWMEDREDAPQKRAIRQLNPIWGVETISFTRVGTLLLPLPPSTIIYISFHSPQRQPSRAGKAMLMHMDCPLRLRLTVFFPDGAMVMNWLIFRPSRLLLQ